MMGVVKGECPSARRIAVDSIYGFVLMELVSGEADIGDSLDGPLDTIGLSAFFNVTQERIVSARVEAVDLTQEQAIDRLRLYGQANSSVVAFQRKGF